MPEASNAVPPRDSAEHGGVVATDVGWSADAVTVLEGVTARLEARRIAVIGENGSGKSTFARLVAGLVAPTTGSLSVHGVDTVTQRRRLRDIVGYVFTDPDAQILLPTPAEDLALSYRGRGLSRDEVAQKVTADLAAIGLADRADQPAYSLSGGQKQLLALTAVLARGPRLLIADEPTTLLDLRNTRLIGDLLLNRTDAQLLLLTHDLDLAARCDVAMRFAAGRLVEVGEPDDVIAHYRQSLE